MNVLQGCLNRFVLGIVLVCLFLGFAGAIAAGIHTWRASDTPQTDVFAGITTPPGITTASVTLNKDLLLQYGAVDEVTSIKSSLPGENPEVVVYYPDSRSLTLGSLTGNSTRNLTLTYNIDRDDTMAMVGPFLGIIIFGGIIWAISHSIWKGR
jgi:hypothetical protein